MLPLICTSRLITLRRDEVIDLKRILQRLAEAQPSTLISCEVRKSYSYHR